MTALLSIARASENVSSPPLLSTCTAGYKLSGMSLQVICTVSYFCYLSATMNTTARIGRMISKAVPIGRRIYHMTLCVCVSVENCLEVPTRK